MNRSLHRRLHRLEHPNGRGDIAAYVDRLFDDPAALRKELEASPARSGSLEAAIDAELWETLEGTCIA